MNRPLDDAEDRERRNQQEERLRKVWAAPRGWRYWSAVNNSEVGLWYTGASLAFMLFAGVLALLVRAQLAVPDNDFLSADTYNQAYTLHGTAMMFLFAVPIFEAVAILLLPQMMSSRDLPFPRLSAFGFWCFIIGGVFVCGSIFFDAAPTGGWFMYPPLTTDTDQSGIGADIWLLGLSFIEIASIAAAVELIVGVLKCRPPGMRINLMPLYAWYVLVVGAMILFAFPPLIAGDLLFELERAFDWPFFDPSRGGDPILWQHLFWIFGHPEVYIVFLPSIALAAMIVPTFAQRPIYGYSWIVLAAVGTGFISFGLWVHHMYTTGLPAISLGFFSAASEAVVIPTGVQLFALIATLLLGQVSLSVPLLYVAGALAIFIFGGLTGVMVAIVPFDWQAHDSYFVVAHLHYTLIGGMFFPLLAGVYYFYPIATGKSLSYRLGVVGFWTMFAGFNATFLPMHLTGLLGMPRRVFTYPADLGWDWLNLFSSVSAAVFAVGVLIVMWDIFRPKGHQPYSERNPWNAGTLEWVARMPPESWGARCVPLIESRYPLWEQPDFVRKVDEGRFYLPDAEEEKRETLITTTLAAEVVQCLRIPGPSFLPMLAAIGIGGSFILATFHWWIAAALSGAAGVAFILRWLWTGTAMIPEKPEKDIGLGATAPLYQSGSNSVGWWAMFITMLADLTAFSGLVFGYFYFWTVHGAFPPVGSAEPDRFWLVAAAVGYAAAWALTLLSVRANANGSAYAACASLVAGIALALGGTAALVFAPSATGMDPTVHAYPAIVWVLILWTGIHAAAGVLMQAYVIARTAVGLCTAIYDADVRNVALYWHFMALTAAVTIAVIGLFPEVSR